MQIFLKIFSRLRIFYIGVCGKIIRRFEGNLFGDLLLDKYTQQKNAHCERFLFAYWQLAISN
jgi:hypothetical protein